MLDRLPTLFATPIKLRVGDREFSMHPLRFQELATLQSWVDSQYRNPLEVAREDFKRDPDYWNMTRQEFMLKEAHKRAIEGPPKIGTPSADTLLLTPEGNAQALFLSVSRGDHSFTIDDARSIVTAINSGDQSEILSATTADMAMHDPKASRATGKGRGSSTSRSGRKP